jgi:transcriptional regulator with XRE-family HTH domain
MKRRAGVRATFSRNLDILLHIERVRGRKALTIAEEIGVRGTLLSLWRRGHSFPRAEQIDKLSEALNVKPEVFFREIDKKAISRLAREAAP